MSLTSQTSLVDISDLPSSLVLAILHNNQYHPEDPEHSHAEMTIKEAQYHLTVHGPNVEVVNGRPIYVHFNLWRDGMLWFNPAKYDAVRGSGAAQAVINHLRNQLTPDLLKDAVASMGIIPPVDGECEE